MTREEFIGKLRSIYVGEENAIDEIISEYDIQKRTIQYLSECINERDGLIIAYREVIDRLNNIINEAIKYNKELAKIYDLGSVERSNADTNLIILQEEEHMQIMKEIAKLKVENND